MDGWLRINMYILLTKVRLRLAIETLASAGLNGSGWVLDGSGWIWMDLDGSGWIWMDLDGFGWIWMDLDGFVRLFVGLLSCIQLIGDNFLLYENLIMCA